MITKILQRSPRLRNIYFRFRLDPEIYQSIIESCPQLDRLEVRDSLSDRFSATWTPYYDGKGHDASSDDSTFRSVSCTVRCHGHIQLEQFISSFVASQLFSIKSLRIGLFSNTILTPFSRLDSILRQDTDNRNQITDLVFEGLPANAAGYVASIVCRTPLLRSLTIIRSSSMLSSTPAVFTALSSRIHLEALSIKACRIHNTGLYDLLEHHRRNIKTIVLECISGIDDRTLWIIASLPGLQTLSLCNVAGVTEDDMQECIKRLGLLSTLKEVRLQGRSRELTPQLAHAIASIKGIEVISMDHIGCTTIETVHRMFEQSHTLKTVHIIQNAGSRCRHETLKRNA
ncbi:hypothetical protein BX666DRAFT_2031636 [Dichotomocladium elegans]|nr:hypothetical protein BX666DRAFT_2031636 [Dichotomocladium elegans]